MACFPDWTTPALQLSFNFKSQDIECWTCSSPPFFPSCSYSILFVPFRLLDSSLLLTFNRFTQDLNDYSKHRNKQGKNHLLICLSEINSVYLAGSALFVPIFPAQNVCNFLFMVEKIPLYMETVCTFSILLSPGLSYCGQRCNAISLDEGVSSWYDYQEASG